MGCMPLSRDVTETVLQDSAALSDKLGFEAAAQAIRGQLEAFRQKKLTVVAAGEARRGKSSLLNALLNEKTPLFPVDINVCTNVVTIVRYGETEAIEAYIEDPKKKTGFRMEHISREQISDYVSEKGNPNNYKRVKMLQASIPNPLLQEGVVFVDTPGVGSLNVEHAETTFSFLPNADVLLFVSDADSGLTESELRFLKRGYQYCKNILFPLTKKDLNANYSAILEDNRQKISITLGIPADELQIIPVSSTAKLRYLQSGRATMLTNSNYAVLEDAIWSSIARRKGVIQLLPFLAAAKSELLTQIDQVAAQYQMLGADQGVAQGLVDELNRKAAALQELQERGADWRGQLALFFSILQNDVNRAQQQIGTNARSLIQERSGMLESRICHEKNYTQLVCDVNDLIGQGILDIREDIAQKVEEKSDELMRQMKFSVSVNEDILDGLGFVPTQMTVVFPPPKAMDTAIKWGRNISMNSMGGGTVGSLLGGFIGLCFGGPAGMLIGVEIGGSVGGLAGGAKGCVDALTKYDQLEVNTVMQTLNQHIASSMSGVSASVGNTIASLRAAVSSSFEQQLNHQVKSLRDNTAQLQRNINMAANEIPQKRAVFKEQSTLLNYQLERYETLEKAVSRLAPSPDPGDTSHTPADSEEVSYGFL
ncbi:MAG: hypothetical protein HFE43_08515 [Oscillospiraceae bacterium]|jgi:tRNA U34 5-carboxymethylaminomethyl modifying GTPase MnmE/TrmE|nr:hypothetical protein [Oscillospiraceae bacterium]